MRTITSNGQTIEVIESYKDVISDVNQFLEKHNEPTLSEEEIKSIGSSYQNGIYTKGLIQLDNSRRNSGRLTDLIADLSNCVFKNECYYKCIKSNDSIWEVEYQVNEDSDYSYLEQLGRHIEVDSYEASIYEDARR